jgi:hypothetical protein
MPNEPDLDQFPILLRDATQRSKIRWEQTPDQDTFRVRLPNGTYARISYESDPLATLSGGVSQWHHVLSLLSEHGYVVQEWMSEGVEELYGVARKSALKVDETVKEAVKSLKKILETTA